MVAVSQDFKDLKSQKTLLVGSGVESLERCRRLKRDPLLL